MYRFVVKAFCVVALVMESTDDDSRIPSVAVVLNHRLTD